MHRYLGSAAVLRDHVHEAQVNEVCAAAYADDSVLPVTLTFSRGLQHREDLWVLQRVHEHKMTMKQISISSQIITQSHQNIRLESAVSVLSKN